LTIEASRIREVGPNKTGAKGSSTVYRIVEPGRACARRSASRARGSVLPSSGSAARSIRCDAPITHAPKRVQG
jgi:hypothetical protein